MEEEAIAIEVLKKIAMDSGRMVAERQRAIDALTLFHAAAIDPLSDIARRTDLQVLKDRSQLYIQRIRSGAVLNMSA